jgi:molybdate transport system permease protein
MEYSQAHGLAGMMLVFSFVVLLGLSWFNRRADLRKKVGA